MIRHLSLLGIALALLVATLLDGGRASAAEVVVPGTEATFRWKRAPGPVAGYAVYISRDGSGYESPEIVTDALHLSAEISGEPGELILVRVAAFDSHGGYGPLSPESAPIRFLAEGEGLAARLSTFSRADGTWTVRDESSGEVEEVFRYGVGPGVHAVVGDWDGDGVSTPGVFDAATGSWYLRNGPGAGWADLSFRYGGSDALPVVGDWNGDGIDTIGIYVPARGEWLLRNRNSAGNPDVSVSYGYPGTLPIVGDWNGDGYDTIGVYHPPSGSWYLLLDSKRRQLTFRYGYEGTFPVAGDWTGSGADGIGLFHPSGLWLLRDDVGSGLPDRVLQAYDGPNRVPVARGR